MQSPIPGFYDRVTAGRLARGAAAVYGDAVGMRGWAAMAEGVGWVGGSGEHRQECLCHVVESEGTETLALVVMTEDRAVVVFRGTRDLRNWLTDLDCEKTDYWIHGRVTRIHRGFWRGWGSVREEIASMVERRRVTLAGHSLGGALAMLAAVDLAQSGTEVAGVYTFGQPRVGNAAFSVQYNFALGSWTFRVVAPGDVVPWVPYLLASFKHAGREVFLTGQTTEAQRHGDGDYRILIPSHGLEPLSASAPLWLKIKCEVAANWHALRGHRFTPLEAHGVDNYMRRLGVLSEKRQRAAALQDASRGI